MVTKSQIQRSKNSTAKNKRQAADRAFWKSALSSKSKAVNVLQDLKNEVEEMLKLKEQLENDYAGVDELASAIHSLNHKLKRKLARITKLEIAIIEKLQSPSGDWIN